MADPARDPVAVRVSLTIVRAIRSLVPAGIRDEWMREWEAEIRHRWSTVSRKRPTQWHDHADVVRRSTGAIADAAWLRRQFTIDHDVTRDVRYALRMLRRRPLMSVLAVLVLALGIGGTVAVFSVVDMLLIRPLPYRDADRIVTIWLTTVDHPEERDGVAPGAFVDWRTRSTVFETIAAAEPWSYDYIESAEPVTLVGAMVTEGFFEAFGTRPALGRSFLPHEYTAGRSDVVLISHGAWQRILGGDPGVVGRQVVLNERPHEIVGVLPEWFHPDVLRGAREQEIWSPKVLRATTDDRRSRYWNVVARLRPNASLEQARAELATISAQLAREYPRTLGRMEATVVPLREHLAGSIRDPLRVLFGAVVLVLLLGCSNVAGMLLARAADRQREFAVRAAIGASRWRLIRQTLVESLALSTLACVGGLAIAHVAIKGFALTASVSVAQLSGLSLDRRLMLCAVVTSGAIAILVGLWPAIRLSRADVRDNLIEGSVSTTVGAHRRRFVSVLIVSEVALALVLLVSAGLLIRSFTTLSRVDPGFTPDNIAVLQVFAYGERYRTDAQRVAFFDRVLEGITHVPGVENAGLVSALPFSQSNINIQGGFKVEGRPAPPDAELPVTSLTVASPDYFAAMQIQLRNGRLFTADDHAMTTPVALINDLMAERFWPAGSPLEQRITVNWQGRWRTMQVVGVVGRLRHDGLDRDPRPEVFIPFSQLAFGSMTFVVRTATDAASLIPAFRSRIWDIDPTMPLYDTTTVDALMAQSLAPRRFITDLLSVLAGLAFLLATLGIYGIVSFATGQRTREIGVRMAVGGSARNILGLMLGDSARLIGLGLLAGLLGSLVTARGIAALLYGVSPTDPLTLAGTTLLLALVALVACCVPAARAMRIDPLSALRAQ